jgi:hypothetical protein
MQWPKAPYTGTSPQSLNKKDLCGLWPRCSCARTIKNWTTELDRDVYYSVHELWVIETNVFYALDCAAEFCPDDLHRAAAKRELAMSFWDRAKRGEPLTEAVVLEISRRHRGLPT